MCTYNKVNTRPTLDIWLTVVPVEYCVEPFKGLSCPGPLGQPVHPFGLMRVFFSVFSAWIYAVVWQVNGAQQQTPCFDLQSDLIFAGGCYTDWIFGWVFAILAVNWWLWTYIECLISNDSITRWFSSSIELLQLTRHGAECLHVRFIFFFWQWVTYSTGDNGVICEESVNDIFTISELGRSVFISARISVCHVKHLHLIEFQMLSGIVMKPSPHCYGNSSGRVVVVG